MRNRYFFNLLVFSFAVLIVLSRPFIVYSCSTAVWFPKQPLKVAALLKSLIKKKNEHSAEAEEVVELSTSRKNLSLPVIFVLLFNKTIWLLALLFSLPLTLRRNNILQMATSNHCNRFVCRFQI